MTMPRLSNANENHQTKRRPNILFAIADDWSWPHAGVYGDLVVKTPAFDRVAREGCVFTNAFAAAPQCSPNRAAILTGRHIWQIEEAGTHSSIFPNKFTVFTNLLESSGYQIGYTGKPWSPGNWELGGWERNPAGPGYNQHKLKSTPADGMNKTDYAGNFEQFLREKPTDKPFFFWYGSSEPHRVYEEGSGLKAGKRLEDVKLPAFLPNEPIVRSDFLDYALEVEWFDHHLEKMLLLLEKRGELDNTLIVVTSDNGMPFPRAKANLYEYGVHMPLAVRWPEQIKPGRNIDDLISFIDYAPTFLEAAGVPPPPAMTGKSFLDVLTSGQSGQVDSTRNMILTGRERHSHARFNNFGYPARALRTHEYLYIRNFKPDRWPAGDPDQYHDIDPGPTKTLMMENKNSESHGKLFDLAFGQRPADELYDVKNDPDCMMNLADRADYAKAKRELKKKLESELKKQQDPRIFGTGDVFESYPRYGVMRKELGGFAERGQYNPEFKVDK